MFIITDARTGRPLGLSSYKCRKLARVAAQALADALGQRLEVRSVGER